MSIGKYSDTLKQSGLQSFLWTQFLGALNDNLYKIVVTLLAADLAISAGGGSGYLPLVAAVFILPFVIFSGYAGHLADVFSKRNVLVVTKVFEILAMILAFFAFFTERIELMVGIVFLMGIQSTFFSPAKYGILPEMLPDRDLSRANGLLEMSTFLAIILGTWLGGEMLAAWNDRLGLIGLVLVGIAVAGTITSLGILRVSPSGAEKPFQMNPWAQIGSGMKRLYAEKILWFTVLGISYFWFLGALIQLTIILLGTEVLALDYRWVARLGAFLAIGIGIGSLAAGRLSGDKVELGLVPLGSIGMGVFSFLLWSSVPSYARVVISLVFLGFSGGLFIVPLYALLQQKSLKEEKGQLLATANFLGTVGVLFASAALWVFRDLLGIQADEIILIFGLLTLAVTFYILKILPNILIRFTLWMVTHTIYRIRIVGQEVVPVRGPALLVCNHGAHVDALLVAACIQRFIRFMIYRPYYELKTQHWLFRLMNAIPVSGEDQREIVKVLEWAREELRQGHLVCIFAEVANSHTGHLLPFKKGYEKIVQGMDIPVIPAYLDRFCGSIFSFKTKKTFWKWLEQLCYPATVSFGTPLPSTTAAPEVQHAVQELGGES